MRFPEFAEIEETEKQKKKCTEMINDCLLSLSNYSQQRPFDSNLNLAGKKTSRRRKGEEQRISKSHIFR
jgi:hypothetical protein